MASRSFAPLLPSCLSQGADAYEKDKKRCLRLIEKLLEEDAANRRSLRSQRVPGGEEAAVTLCYGPMSREEMLACDEEEKRLLAELEALQSTGATDCRLNGGGDKASPFLEPLSPAEIRKRQRVADKKRLLARRSALDSRSKPNSAKVHPLILTKKAISAPAMAVGNTQDKPPVRVTFADRFGPESDALFLKNLIESGKSGEGLDRFSRHESDRLKETKEAYLRRQRYLRDHCPFQMEEEEESMPEKTKPAESEPEDEEEEEVVERTVPVRPAYGPDSEAVFLKSIIDKNQGGEGEGTEEVAEDYYTIRREFLKSFEFTVDKRSKGEGIKKATKNIRRELLKSLKFALD